MFAPFDRHLQKKMSNKMYLNVGIINTIKLTLYESEKTFTVALL